MFVVVVVMFCFVLYKKSMIWLLYEDAAGLLCDFFFAICNEQTCNDYKETSKQFAAVATMKAAMKRKELLLAGSSSPCNVVGPRKRQDFGCLANVRLVLTRSGGGGDNQTGAKQLCKPVLRCLHDRDLTRPFV